ncbi:MAG: CDP-alcohol phosphatidyltransferase-domain-containing protein, partial [Olpidium bornovanus]
MQWVDSDHVSRQGLENLALYKYAAVDRSFVTKYFLRHYWEWAVTLFPVWMAPNLITLIGLGFVLVNLATVVVFIPDLIGPAPSWMYFSFAVGLWLYSTFDNVDGKQARRTKSSSPLGELFDHGCDSLNCSVSGRFPGGTRAPFPPVGRGCREVVRFRRVVPLDAPRKDILPLGSHETHVWAFRPGPATLPFYFSTWEEYHTGVLYLGYVNGPTEGIIIACLLMIASGIWGPQIWTLPVRSLVGRSMPAFIPEATKVVDVLVVAMMCLLFLLHIPCSLNSVRKACLRKGQSFSAALLELTPMMSYVLAAWAWLAAPASVARENHLVLFTLTVGIVFGHEDHPRPRDEDAFPDVHGPPAAAVCRRRAGEH